MNNNLTINHTPNFTEKRGGHDIEAIVIHVTDASKESTMATMFNEKEQKSYHYLVMRDGSVVELVAPENTAWHAGNVKNPSWSLIKPNVNPNMYTLGISMVANEIDGPTIEQIATVGLIVRHCCGVYNIPIDNKHIIPHNAIRSDKTCPTKKTDIGAILYLANLAHV